MSIFQRMSGTVLDIVETVVVALSIFLVVYLFFMQPHQVNGQSMEPTFLSGEYVLTDKVSYQTGEPRRGDVVVFHAPEAAGCPQGTGCDFIKRIIGLPGDTISVHDNALYINGQALPEPYIPPENYTKAGEFTQGGREIYLGENEYFAVGDNRPFSSDSRVWGPIGKQNIVGRAFLRYWPLEKVGLIPRVAYEGFSR
ncbi:signal peptidase I [Candidatus Woesebacteria bacterium]|nr:signal peptidase I [Candidatus Woesebacteria bacterium]MCD8506863.1 signal peptidase I [Candidatus Woesebacteria bacterium]MCD8527517.1 signal peptidase I [Candidatus Woesebacteria bacterium]MCD8546257.1 signal peptidase I [Candidatus Woesebacteria bacterium]